MTPHRQLILDTVTDLVACLLYYDRKEDDELGVGGIQASIAAGEITVEEIVTWFRTEFENGVK